MSKGNGDLGMLANLPTVSKLHFTWQPAFTQLVLCPGAIPRTAAGSDHDSPTQLTGSNTEAPGNQHSPKAAGWGRAETMMCSLTMEAKTVTPTCHI